MDYPEEKKEHFECQCGSEILAVQEMIDFYGNNNEKMLQEFNFCFYGYGMYTPKPNLWERIKYAFKHIWTGRIWEDQIVLSRTDAKALCDFLVDRINQYS